MATVNVPIYRQLFASLSLASIGIEWPPPKLIQSPSDLRSHTRRRIGGVLSSAAECSTGFASITLTFPARANMLRQIAWSSRSAKSSRVMTAVLTFAGERRQGASPLADPNTRGPRGAKYVAWARDRDALQRDRQARPLCSP